MFCLVVRYWEAPKPVIRETFSDFHRKTTTTPPTVKNSATSDRRFVAEKEGSVMLTHPESTNVGNSTGNRGMWKEVNYRMLVEK
jgi:hypothetical protein